MSLPKAILGKTELPVSRLGFGGAPMGFLNTPDQQVGKLLNLLLDEGVSLIDTAAMYVGSEEAIGQSAAHRRSEYTLVTKCGMGDDDLPGSAWSRRRLLATIDRSLKRLKTDVLDIVLLHSCDLDTLKKGEAIEAMVAAREQGKTRFVGYSGDNGAAAWAAAHPELSVIEMSLNIVDQRNARSALPICREHDKGVILKRPIANACWKPLSRQQGIYKNYASEYTRRLARMGLSPHDLGYYDDADLAWPEIALKFALSFEGVHTAIVGTTSTLNAQLNVEAVRKHALREQVIQKLQAAFTAGEKQDGKPWPALT